MKMTATTKDAQKLFHEGIMALSEASIQGMCIDVPYCKKQDKYLDKKIKVLKRDFFKSDMGKLWRKIYPSTNINSDQQLRTILFEKKQIRAVKTTDPSKLYPDGQPSVDSETLEIIGKKHPDVTTLMDIRKLSKVQGTYIQGMLKEQVNGKIHPFFPLDRVRTFRSSSSNINFQNQPNRDKKQRKIVRSGFIPSDGHQLVAEDFKGIEVAVSACNNLDPKMIKYVSDPKSDMHGDMTIQCYMLDQFKKDGTEKILRKGAKNGFVFPQFYGDYYGNNAPVLCNWGKIPVDSTFKKDQGLELMTGVTLGQHFINKGIYDYEDFVDHIKDVENDFWNRRFKKYSQWKKKNVAEYYKKGFLQMLTGFTCSGLMSQNDINNYPIQGAAFHCLLKTFIRMNKLLKKYNMKSKLIGQIHDELVFDCDPKETQNILEMTRETVCFWLPKQWEWIIVPMEIEAGVFEPDANWATASKEYKLAA